MATEGEDKVKEIADQKAAEKAALEKATADEAAAAQAKASQPAKVEPPKSDTVKVSIKETADAPAPKLSKKTLDEMKSGKKALERTNARVAAKEALAAKAEPAEEK